MRQFFRAVVERVTVEVGVQLDDQCPGAEFLVDREDAEVVARQPEQEFAVAQVFPGDLPAGFPPAGHLVQRLERALLDPEPFGERVLPGRPGFLRGVVDDLVEDVPEELGPGPGAGAAEQVEREDDGGGSHTG